MSEEPKISSGPPTVADVYGWHELGTKNKAGETVIPARPSLTWVMDNKEAEIIEMSAKTLMLVMEGKMLGKTALGFVGEKVVSLVKARIKSNIPPGLSEARKRAKMRGGKSGNVALIHTGQLINSLRWQITGSVG